MSACVCVSMCVCVCLCSCVCPCVCVFVCVCVVGSLFVTFASTHASAECIGIWCNCDRIPLGFVCIVGTIVMNYKKEFM